MPQSYAYRSGASTANTSLDTSRMKHPKRVSVIRKYPTVIPIVLGTILLVCFFSSVLINIFGLVPFPNPWSRAVLPFFVCGHGFWGGALYALAGSLTIAAGKLKLKALIYGSMVTCMLAAVSVGGVIACSCVGLSSRDITVREVLTLNLTMLLFGLLALGCCIWAAYIAARLMCECCQPDIRYTSAPTSPNQSQSQEGFLSLAAALETKVPPQSNNSFNHDQQHLGKQHPVSMTTMPGDPRIYDRLNASGTAPLSRSSSKPSSIMSDPASEHQLTSLSVVASHTASQKLSQMSLSSSTAPPYREESFTPPVGEQGNYGIHPEQIGYSHRSAQPQPDGYPLRSAQPQQDGYPLRSAKPQQDGYPLRSAQPQQDGYPLRSAQPQQDGYPNRGSQPQQDGYPNRGSQPQQDGYPNRGSQPQQDGYPLRSAQPQQDGYPNRGSPPQQDGYPLRSAQPQQDGYPNRGSRPLQDAYIQDTDPLPHHSTQPSLNDDSLDSYHREQGPLHQYAAMPTRGVVHSNHKQSKPSGYSQHSAGGGMGSTHTAI